MPEFVILAKSGTVSYYVRSLFKTCICVRQKII